MAVQMMDTLQQQLESLVFNPARAYMALTLNHAATLTAAQIDAYQAYAEAGIQQARSLSQVKDASGLSAYLQQQQQVVQKVSERMQGDAGKLVAINQEFVGKTQQLAEQSARDMTLAATKASV